MDTKTLVKALKIAVREVIKEELTDILREGLQSTITEIKQSKRSVPNTQQTRIVESKKSKVHFNDNKWADILNETDPLTETEPLAMNSFKEMMNEGMEEIRMTSKDAVNFGAMRQNMKEAIGASPAPVKIMEDPETGKVYDVAPEVQRAITRDYSALMKAINNKKGR